ncbi:MAG: hypothetical protein H7301_06000 [Cryobacterium sp.]|nr:hypothetical protein [Oligoflexia bacterium]
MANTYQSKKQVVPSTVPQEEGEMDLIATWLIFDLPRTIAGAMAGITAGLIAWVFAGILAVLSGTEFWYPFKIPAAPILGNDAMTFGITPAILIGTVLMLAISGVLGMVYSHFVKSNRMDALLGAGFMWGTFSWIFINNLFVNSFQNIRELDLPKGAAFFVLLLFGFSLSSLKIYDRIICGRHRA